MAYPPICFLTCSTAGSRDATRRASCSDQSRPMSSSYSCSVAPSGAEALRSSCSIQPDYPGGSALNRRNKRCSCFDRETLVGRHGSVPDGAHHTVLHRLAVRSPCGDPPLAAPTVNLSVWISDCRRMGIHPQGWILILALRIGNSRRDSDRRDMWSSRARLRPIGEAVQTGNVKKEHADHDVNVGLPGRCRSRQP